MSKVLQENYLVVYREDMDYLEKLEWLISEACEGRYKYTQKSKKLVVKTRFGFERCYYFNKFNGNTGDFIEPLRGSEYLSPIFLSGEYPDQLINWILNRCRNGTCMVDAI